VGEYVAGMWCPRIRGGVAEGAQGDGGFIRNMPDSGGVRWVLVGLWGMGESVFGLGVVNGCMWCMGVGVCTFMMCESFKYSVCECMCGCVVCWGFICGLWCPSMRRGDVVGDHGGGSWVVGVLGGVGVRWGLVEYRMIGERENGICGWF